MSRVHVAASAGFCFGVSRSVRMAEAMLEKGPCKCLGPLIHNAEVVGRLEARGLTVLDSPEQARPGDRVLIRSHGVGADVLERLRARGAEVTDATCPNVARIHRLVAEASARGRQVLVLGTAGHPEVLGVCGRCEGAVVISGAEELQNWLDAETGRREAALTMVVQTTQTAENLRECEFLIKKLCTNAEIFDTICFATSTRQAEAMRLAAACDAMVVIGGRHSANSLHLARLCEARCPNTQFIESAAELDTARLRAAADVGVTAGASAPEWIIKEVLVKMSDEILIQENPVEEAPVEETLVAETSVEPAPAAEAQAEEVPAEEVPAAETPVEEAPAEESPEEAAPAEAQPAAEEPAEPEAPAANVEKSFDEMLEDSLKTIYNGDRVNGTVVAITPTEVSVDLGTKYSAFIPVAELTEDGAIKIEEVVRVGDPIEAIVVRVNDVEGTAQLSKKRLDAIKSWADIEAAQEDGTVVEGTVTEENKGGVVVSVRGIRVFVPASQSGLPKDTPMTELVKQKVRLKITEVNRGRKRVVGSIRAVAQRERRERAEAIWNEIEVGKVYQGTVKSMTSYGAFVDIGGIDGMVHVSELSWSRVKNPAEVVSVGDPLEVYVIGFDKEHRRISLGFKKPEDNPWNQFVSAYEVGSVARVKIVKLMPFGAFAEVMPGVDGLIHISQIANRRIARPDEALTVGDIVEVKITAIDNEKQKISLSIRALSEPEPAQRRQADDYDAEPAAPQEDALVYEVSETGEATGNIPYDAGAED